MAIHWDGRGYAYRTFRDGDKVRKEYIGKGEIAELTCRMERDHQAQRDAVANQDAAHKEAESALEAPVRVFAIQIEVLRRLLLSSWGYHQHSRGAWRRKRLKQPIKPEELTMARKIEKSNPTPESQKSATPTSESLVVRLKRAQAAVDAGQRENTDEAQEFLAEAEQAGTLEGFLNLLADMGASAQRDIVKRIAQDDPLTLAAYATKTRRMKADLCGPAPSELEKQLAERIVLEWLLLTYFEARLTANLESEKWVPYYEKRIESAQRRYLSSIKALAQIRKLKLPNLQINVAEQQINQQLNG